MVEGLYTQHSGVVNGQETRPNTGEEHSLKEQTNRSRIPHRTPKRSQTTHDYKIPISPFQDARYVVIQRGNTSSSSHTPSPLNERTLEAALAVSRNPGLAAISEDVKTTQPRRPTLPPPRRSYSVMDYEPLPPEQKPCVNLTLSEIPAEIHYAIFDWLDPIDSACLGLANKHFYEIHRRMHGSTPLSVRRSGPNDMEWAWHLACTVKTNEKHSMPEDILISEKDNRALLRVRGKALCRKCGVSRCELHKHIAEWMGNEYEYCTVRQKFGSVAPDGAKEFCFMSNPKDPHRCGRHRARNTPIASH